MAQCKYCKLIHERDRTYKVRKASKDIASDFPRCSQHWQFVCDECKRSLSFHAMTWCNDLKKFLCIKCAPRHKKVKRHFWAWNYYYGFWCESCERFHPALDFLEYAGKHPWQIDRSARRRHRGLNPGSVLKPWGFVRWATGKNVHPTQFEVQKRWDQGAEVWVKGYTKFGDSYRRNLFNPALFSMIGDVEGKKILDAGCGSGYMARLLAERGAEVTGVDLSRRFIEIAKQNEKKKPLGITYIQGDLAHVPQLKTAYFDLVVSVYVLCDVRDHDQAIKEIGRVLKHRGRFIYLIEHPCFSWQSGGWERIPADSHRTEDFLYLKVDNYFKRGTQETQWGNLPVLLTFFRPLSDYFHAMKMNGLVVSNLTEPRPRPDAIQKRPADRDRENRVPPVLIIEALKLQTNRDLP